MSVTSAPSLKAVLDLLELRGADGLPHGPKRTLNDHLRGTMQILSHWAQPDTVIAAGLLHSIYGTDIYRYELIPLAERKKVASVAGNVAESLAYLFCTVRRNSLFDALVKFGNADWNKLAVEEHAGSKRVELTRDQVGQLLVIHMANTAEQTHHADRSPGIWVSATSRWGAWAKPLCKRVPPVFDSCGACVAQSAEQEAVDAYASGLRRIANHRGAAAADFLAAAEHLPWVAEPLLLLGYCALRDFQWSDAFQYAHAGLRRLVEWGTPWDKRLAYNEWKIVATVIAERAETGFADPAQAERLTKGDTQVASTNAIDALRALARSRAVRVPKKTPATTGLPPRFLSYLSRFRDSDAPAKHNFYPGLSNRPVHPSQAFALAKALQKAYPEIRAEFHSLRPDQGFQEERENIARTGQWDVFMLYELGKRVEANCALCPVTASVVEKYAAVRSISNAVYFSILLPHTHVAAHRGPTNMRLRCHLGLEIPEGCRLRVGEETVNWREGKCVVFDDSFTHEVWNDSDKPRAVLVVDVWHPDLSAEEVALLNELQRYVFVHAKEMSGYWLKSEKARAALRAH